MKPRPIFHCDGEPGLRGGERQLLYLAAALRARGRAGLVWAAPGGELEAEARRQGFETASGGTLALIRRARAEGAIVHAHTAGAAKAAALASWAGVRTVSHRRVDFEVAPLSARWKYGSAGKVVCVSRAIRDILERAGTPASKLCVVADCLPVTAEEARWAGVDPARFALPSPGERSAARLALRAEFNLPKDAPLVGNLAALVPHKDHDTLIAAAVIVLLKRPDARFLIAGKGPEERALFESIKRMGLLGKVVLAGHRPDPASFLKALDVYVQSSWGEGMGSVLIEAAACGAPVCATRAGGIPEVVEDGSTGLLVEPRNPEALAGIILRLLGDETLRAGFAAAARAGVSRFGLTRTANEMESIYDSLS